MNKNKFDTDIKISDNKIEGKNGYNNDFSENKSNDCASIISNKNEQIKLTKFDINLKS